MYQKISNMYRDFIFAKLCYALFKYISLKIHSPRWNPVVLQNWYIKVGRISRVCDYKNLLTLSAKNSRIDCAEINNRETNLDSHYFSINIYITFYNFMTRP